MSTLRPQPESQTLWHVRGHGRETHPPGRTYWWNNARLPPDGGVVQFTQSGQIQYRDADGSRAVGPGTFLLFRYGDSSHYGQPEPLKTPYVCRWLSLFGAGATDHLSSLIRRHGPTLYVGLDHPLVDQHDRLITQAARSHEVEPTELAGEIHHFVMGLYDLAELRLKEKLAPVEMAIQSILRRPHQPMSLKEIAAHFDVSREHLSRTFRQTVGRSAHDVLAEAKCQRALSLLKQTHLPIAEVARQAGYANPHSLARQVRHATGHAPTAYRNTT